MDQLTLGIGTRLQHTQYGPGVIVGMKYAAVPLGDKWKGGTELRRSFVPRSFSFVTFAPLGYPPVRRSLDQTKRSTHRRFLP